jgi:hypothetical protein
VDLNPQWGAMRIPELKAHFQQFDPSVGDSSKSGAGNELIVFGNVTGDLFFETQSQHNSRPIARKLNTSRVIQAGSR